ncbi:MAG: outer membrane protein assembly factor BamD [candidate division WOR-3 bacterium]
MRKNLFVIFLFFLIVFSISCAKREKLTQLDISDEELFNRAFNFYEQKKWDKSIDLFQKYIFTYPANKKTELAQYYLADSYFNKRSYTESIVEFEYFIKNYKSYNLKKDALYKLSISYFKIAPPYQFDQSLTFSAIGVMREFLMSYYDDERSKEIDSMLNLLISRIEEKKLHTGDFYYRGKKYRSAEIYYELVDVNNLRNDLKDRYYFSYGRALFMNKNYKKSLEILQKVSENSKYFKESKKIIDKISKFL